jgi:RHS repeat-associated protein
VRLGLGRGRNYVAKAPFGEELSAGVGIRSESNGYSSDSVRQKFGSKERDNETGLDFFEARYYSNIQGRFTSVDPENAGAIQDDPQSWNGYAYARNNPTTYGDPNGTEFELCDLNGKCSNHSDKNVEEWQRQDKATLKKGKIFDKDGNQIGTFRRRSYDSWDAKSNAIVYGRGGLVDRAPQTSWAVQKAGEHALGTILLLSVVRGGGRVSLGLSGAAASEGVITGLYGTTTVATLESLASSGGPTVKVVTNLTQAPIAGRGLSTAIGSGAEALANQAGAIRGAGQVFRAQIPRALLEELKRIGLAREITTRMGGVTGTEVRFAPQITKFIVNFFK